MRDPFPSDDEWEYSPYAQYVGVGVDEEEDSRLMEVASRLVDEHTGTYFHDDYHASLSYRLSYWFWLHVYRLQRRLGLMR